jgi:hypothetical protein
VLGGITANDYTGFVVGAWYIFVFYLRLKRKSCRARFRVGCRNSAHSVVGMLAGCFAVLGLLER